VHDSSVFPNLMAEAGSVPKHLLADKGYDSDAIREYILIHGGTPEIPTKRNRRVQHNVDHALYALRNRIERFFNKLKNSRRVATRYDKTASSFLGFTQLAAIKLWIGFVHAA
jgi:transposase